MDQNTKASDTLHPPQRRGFTYLPPNKSPNDVGQDQMQAKTHLYMHIYIYNYENICNKVYIYFFSLHLYLNAYIYGFMWLNIPIYAPFRHLRGVQNLFTVYYHPGIWYILHQADIAMMQLHPNSKWRAAIPDQLPCHIVIQFNEHLYKCLRKPNLLMFVNNSSVGNILLPSRYTDRPLGEGAGRYERLLIILPIYTDPVGRLNTL